MVIRRNLSWMLCVLVAGQPVLGGPSPDLSFSSESIVLFDYPGNHGFIHQTGAHVSNGWAARYRIDLPGYFISGRINGGEALQSGLYQYVFYLKPQPGSLGGLLRRAADVVRLEAWDRTANERVLFRTFQIADFPTTGSRLVRKSVAFSADGRSGHVFEPRLYWTGFSGLYLQRIELRRLSSLEPEALSKKAGAFEALMGERFLDRGFVVSRDVKGRPDDIGDAAIWTGLYAASQAWRYQATRSQEALSRMEDALRALHRLHAFSGSRGTLVRYLNAKYEAPPDSASKDSYTGFFFAIAHCLSSVRDRKLHRELTRDTEALANHFLDQDLAFVPNRGAPIEFNPFPSGAALDEGLAELQKDPRARRGFIRLLQGIHLYFLSRGQRPWPELRSLIGALKRNDMPFVREQLAPVLNGALRALAQLQRNVQRSDESYRLFLTRRRAPGVSYPPAPYGKLNALLVRMLRNLSGPLEGRPIGPISDVKTLPSQALHALHFLKVAAEALPKPNRFDDYYRANLWDNKKLLKTLLDWHNVDEDALAAVYGHSRAAVMRGASHHLPSLALYNLIRLERDPAIRNRYRALFEDEYLPMQEDYNAMLHVMRGVLAMPPEQTGIGLWSLGLYPTDRRGLGGSFWRRHHAEWAARHGGALLGQARDPVPVDRRQRDSFIWQRSARSIGGDDDQKMYPPMDYLFVYWMARAFNLIGGP